MGVSAWVGQNRVIVISLVLTLALFGGIVLWEHRGRVDKDDNGPGSIGAAIAVQGDDGQSSLLLIEWVHHTSEDSSWDNWRFTQIDPIFGKIYRREQIPDAHEQLWCRPASANMSSHGQTRMWCQRDYAHLELRDVRSMAVITDDAKLAKSSADLSQGIMIDSRMMIDVAKSTLEVQTKDGYHVLIDAQTLATKRLTAESDNTTPNDDRMPFGGWHPGAQCVTARLDGENEVALVGSPRQRLYVRLRGAANGQGRVIGEASYLYGKIICRNWKPLLLPPVSGLSSKRTYVIVDATTLDAQSKNVYTAVDEESGQVRWSYQDAGGEVTQAEVVNNSILYLVVRTTPNTVIGLDTKTGRLMYRYDGSRK